MFKPGQESAINVKSFTGDSDHHEPIGLRLAQELDDRGWASVTHTDTTIEGASDKGSAVLETVVLTHTDSLSQKTDEDVAQANYLRGRILHIIVPELTNGNVITPEALGYTYIPQQGFAQVIERMDSHSPRLDDGGEENQRIRQARVDLWSRAEETGIEPLTHIHPKNPLGKSNFRVHDDGRLIWLDQYTDLPLSGAIGRLILPQFDFYKDAIDIFETDQKNPSFRDINAWKIHSLVDKFDMSAEDRELLRVLLDEYQILQNTISQTKQRPYRELVANDLENLDDVSRIGAQVIRSSEFGHRAVRAAQKGGEIVEYTGGKIQSTTVKSFVGFKQFMANRESRKNTVLEKSILKGLSVAKEHGNISDKEYKEALDVVSPHDLNTYVGLQGFYLANSRAFDVITGSLIATHPSPKEILAIFTAGTVGSSAVRGAVTAVTSRFRDTDLKKATVCSMIPMLGGYTAIIQQMMSTYGEYTKDIKHNAFRLLASNISNIGVGGGWGSDREEKIWQKSHDGKKLYHVAKLETQAIISNPISALSVFMSKSLMK